MLTFDYIYTFNHFNLGNNFTFEHLIEEISEQETFEQFYEELTNLPNPNNDALITIKAKLNFGYSLKETFCLFELCECLEHYYDNIYHHNNF